MMANGCEITLWAIETSKLEVIIMRLLRNEPFGRNPSHCMKVIAPSNQIVKADIKFPENAIPQVSRIPFAMIKQHMTWGNDLSRGLDFVWGSCHIVSNPIANGKMETGVFEQMACWSCYLSVEMARLPIAWVGG